MADLSTREPAPLSIRRQSFMDALRQSNNQSHDQTKAQHVDDDTVLLGEVLKRCHAVHSVRKMLWSLVLLVLVIIVGVGLAFGITEQETKYVAAVHQETRWKQGLADVDDLESASEFVQKYIERLTDISQSDCPEEGMCILGDARLESFVAYLDSCPSVEKCDELLKAKNLKLDGQSDDYMHAWTFIYNAVQSPDATAESYATGAPLAEILMENSDLKDFKGVYLRVVFCRESKPLKDQVCWRESLHIGFSRESYIDFRDDSRELDIHSDLAGVRSNGLSTQGAPFYCGFIFQILLSLFIGSSLVRDVANIKPFAVKNNQVVKATYWRLLFQPFAIDILLLQKVSDMLYSRTPGVRGTVIIGSFRLFWQYFDIFMFRFGCGCTAVFVACTLFTDTPITNPFRKQDMPWDIGYGSCDSRQCAFDELGVIYDCLYLLWLGWLFIVVSLLSTIRTLKSFRFHAGLSIIYRTLFYARHELLDVVVLILVIMMGFWAMLHPMLGLFAQHEDFVDADGSFLTTVRMAFGLYGFDQYQNENRGRAFDGMGIGRAGPFKVLVYFGCFFLLSLIIPNILLAVVVDAYEKAVDEESSLGLVFGKRENIVDVVCTSLWPRKAKGKMMNKFAFSPEAQVLLRHFVSPYTDQLLEPISFPNWTIPPMLLHNSTYLKREELLDILQRSGSWTSNDATRPLFSPDAAAALVDTIFSLWGGSMQDSVKRVENAVAHNSNYVRIALKEEVKKIEKVEKKIDKVESDVAKILAILGESAGPRQHAKAAVLKETKTPREEVSMV